MNRIIVAVVAIILCTGVFILGLAFMNTLFTSNGPVSMEVRLELQYQGSQTGSFTLRYTWVSEESEFDTDSEFLSWKDSQVTTSSTSSNSIEKTILNHLQEATASSCPFRISEDGTWTASFSFLIGGSFPVGFECQGQGLEIESVVASGDANLLPSGLKNDLRNLGITNLDVEVSWRIQISGEFLYDWANNVLQTLTSIWNVINPAIDEGVQRIGNIIP